VLGNSTIRHSSDYNTIMKGSNDPHQGNYGEHIRENDYFVMNSKQSNYIRLISFELYGGESLIFRVRYVNGQIHLPH
jgi:hypothetical protein